MALASPARVIRSIGGVVKIPLRLLTFLSPTTSLGLSCHDGDLPYPYEMTREKKNEFISEEGKALGVTTRPVVHKSGAISKTGAVGNGNQPQTLVELIGKLISSRDIADIIEEGQFWGNYQRVTSEEDRNFSQMQLQFRSGACPSSNQDSVLTRDQVATVVHVLREEIGDVKVGGIWVNPKPGVAAFHSNVVLRSIQEGDKAYRNSPVMRDEAGFYIEVDKDVLAGICPFDVVFV